MNTMVIDTAFSEMICQRGIHNTLGVTNNYVVQLRHKLKNNIGISTDTKLRLLQKTGWRQDEKTYTRSELVRLAKYILRASAAAKAHGAEYLVEKWERTIR